MATEEIEISELEFTEELASDNLIPVESATDTKATSLQILKNWLSRFFVGKTGNETINGAKTFTTSPKIVNPTGQNTQLRLSDATANSEIGVMQATSNGKNQFLVRFANGNRFPLVISQDASDNAKFTYELVGSPVSSNNSTQIATTAWVLARGYNWGSGVSMTSGVAYTCPSRGILVAYATSTQDGNFLSIRYGSTNSGILLAYSPTGGYNKGNCVAIPVIAGEKYFIEFGGAEKVHFFPYK